MPTFQGCCGAVVGGEVSVRPLMGGEVAVGPLVGCKVAMGPLVGGKVTVTQAGHLGIG